MTFEEVNRLVVKAIADKTDASSEFEIEGISFKVKWYESICDLCAWADNGRTSVYSTKAKTFPDALKHIDNITTAIMEYTDGYIHCSDCGKLIKIEDIGGGYFAGRYCKECWESKWKEIEANETYD